MRKLVLRVQFLKHGDLTNIREGQIVHKTDIH